MSRGFHRRRQRPSVAGVLSDAHAASAGTTHAILDTREPALSVGRRSPTPPGLTPRSMARAPHYAGTASRRTIHCSWP